ncbi:TPA: DUF3560 domain-containing protein [Pasteurella multocida]|nr:DUF3560 domain-containing protein [Pasteurella multocida]HDX1039797.1 DUF3560 domain-containing protein [Pasteurella multocida]HDX1141770.1 DUF3560 domain-containing protein [Pasteurella multocida]HDX1142596.1 DUF3560 domain-containing protein [Pasteurella multocida]
MNTYAKFAPTVFVAKCTEPHQKGDIVTLTSKYGNETEVEIHNLVKQQGDCYFYSFTRCDGVDSQTRAVQKAERYQGYARNAMKRSAQYSEAANEGREFLRLGEPIKIGHHSEKRHRALMNPLMILVKIIKLRWIHILSYDQMVSRKINNQTTRCANSIFYTTLFTNSAPNYT